jgi:anti-sigma-K factor RskA
VTPDFDELVGTDLDPEERERLRRAHDLLVAAGPPPELPPGLVDPSGPPEAEVIPFWNRRRNAALAVLAAALAALAFGVGYLTGHNRSGQSFTEGAIVMSGTAAAPAGAHGSIQLGSKDDAGNWPMLVRVSNLGTVKTGEYYTLWLTRKGRAVAPCGSFVVRGGEHPTEVQFTVAYQRSRFDGWVVTLQSRKDRTPGKFLLRTKSV